MKLKKIRVTNFRSVEDSTEFDVEQLLCLVGKNEAGKTAVEQALAGLNPHPAMPITYNLERDYPRRWLAEYADRHQGEEATVITTKWSLSADELSEIVEIAGPNPLAGELVTISRRYRDDKPRWHVQLDLPAVLRNVMDMEGLDEDERKPLAAAKDTASLKEALNAIGEQITTRQKRLLDRLSNLPGGAITNAVTERLKGKLPLFLYSSHYDRMVGELRIDQYDKRKTGQLSPPISPGEQVFIDFLEYAGTTVKEITEAKTYETLNARCESASNRITAQLQEYWKQNPHIEIDVRVTKAEPNDAPPLNDGVIARARVKNTLHKVTVPFSERSAGFIWFFSFLVKFAQVRKTGDNLVLLLDEPGLTLHGKAQADLLRYFTEKLVPQHQVVFTTHSPFMVPVDDLPSVRVVEDKLLQVVPGQWTSDGTKVRDDTMATDRDTLFPLQGALGYEITQTLFVGRHTLLVEGPGDVLALQALSSELGRRGRPALDRRWTLCPAGGIDKIQPFVALFSGQKLNIAVLSDYAKGDKKKLDALARNKIMEGQRFLTYATLLSKDEADLEDLFSPDLYAKMLNGAFNLAGQNSLTGKKLLEADPTTDRLVKKAEAYFRTLAPDIAEFDHYTPMDYLLRNPDLLAGDGRDVAETLGRAELVIAAVNRLV